MKHNRILFGMLEINRDQRLHNLHEQLSAARAKGDQNRALRVRHKIAEREEHLRPKPLLRPYQGGDTPLWQ